MMCRFVYLVMVAMAVCQGVLSETPEERLKKLENLVTGLSRQAMMQQLAIEERVRSQGATGMKHTRLNTIGSRPYYASTFSDGVTIAGVHDHCGQQFTSGFGEFVAVMNGVEFRTRHNDYWMYQKGKSSNPAAVPIEFPDVPDAVTKKGSAEAQIIEMREWFKAWKNEDHSKRDYRKHFFPILCYVEGHWANSEQNSIDKLFAGDTHKLAATSWMDLVDRVKFAVNVGRKDPKENLGYLPTTIMSVENGVPVIAQWKYRILCHKIKNGLSPKRLTIVDDLHSRVRKNNSHAEFLQTMGQRFRVVPEDKDNWRERALRPDLLDKLMMEIPGFDGYGKNLQDKGMEGTRAARFLGNKPLNAANYHRWFLGSGNEHRGFSDENLFMAMTTSKDVAGMKTGKVSQKWTYAFPLEIIYFTPLQKWNPYNLKHDQKNRITGDGKTAATSFPFTNIGTFYRTPVTFYDDQSSMVKQRSRWVTQKEVMPSGAYVLLPEIKDVGRIRTRYPIMPLHQEGTAVWKEMDTFKDMFMKPASFDEKLYPGSAYPWNKK